MFVKLDQNGAPTEWPVTRSRIKHENPSVGFPLDMTGVNVREYGFAPYTLSDPAEYDAQWQRAEELTPVEVGGIFVQQWKLVDRFTETEKAALTAQLLAEKLEAQKASIKARRDTAINAGTTLSGMTVATDNLSQQRITGAALAATLDNTTTVKWKLPDDSFVILNATQIVGIAQAVRAHVQACFDREAELLAAFAAGTAYDINAGWPA